MTVAIEQCKTIVLGNGVQTVFDYDFPITIEGYVDLWYTDADGIVSLIDQSEYLISGVGNPTGGTFTYPLIGTPIANGTSLTLIRNNPYTQTTNLSSQGSYDPRAVMKGLDQIVYQTQQLFEIVGRTLRMPPTENAQDPLLSARRRANSVLGFDNAGAVTYLYGNPPVIATGTFTVSVFDFGAVGDGITDDHEAFTAAGNAVRTTPAVLVVPEGYQFYIGDNLDWTGIRYIWAFGEIIMADGKILDVGGFSNRAYPVNWYFDNAHDVSATEWPTSPIINVGGVKGGNIYWGYVPRIRITADATDPDTMDNSNAYFIMYGGFINRVDLYSRGGGWNNDICWIKPRVKKIIQDTDAFGEYGQWRFIDGIFEGSDVEINLTIAKDWLFDGIRLEGTSASPGFTLGANVFNLRVHVKRTSNTAPYFIFLLEPDTPWNDSGYANYIQQQAVFERPRINLVTIDHRSIVLSDGGTTTASEIDGMESPLFKQGADCIEATSNNALLYLSAMIPITPGMLASYWCRATIPSARPRVYCYDENKQLITAVTEPGGVTTQSIAWVSAQGYYGISAPVADRDIAFNLAGSTRYIRLAIASGSGGAGAPWYIKETGFDIYMPWYKPLDGISALMHPMPRLALAAAPVGVAPIGTIIIKSDGTAQYNSIRYAATTISATEAGGQTVISVASVTGISVGDQILIALDTGATHVTTVTAVGASTVTINVALPSQALIGNMVKTGAWATVTY